MNEITYTDPVTLDEFMVDMENGHPIRIYCYADNRSLFINTSNWHPRQNQLFKHCPRIFLRAAYQNIQESCVALDVPNIIAIHF